MKKGRKSKNLPIFENEKYRITQIPLNYAIDVKMMKDGNKRHKRVKLVPEQLYSPLERGVAYAREMADYIIHKYENLPAKQNP